MFHAITAVGSVPVRRNTPYRIACPAPFVMVIAFGETIVASHAHAAIAVIMLISGKGGISSAERLVTHASLPLVHSPL